MIWWRLWKVELWNRWFLFVSSFELTIEPRKAGWPMTDDVFDFDLGDEEAAPSWTSVETSVEVENASEMLLPEPTGALRPEPGIRSAYSRPKTVEEACDTLKTTEIVTSKASIQDLYLDIETIPDYSREHLFGLPPLPVVPPELPADQLLSPEEFLSQGVDEIKSWFAKNTPPEEWLQALEAAERKAAGKKGNRKGLFEAVEKARDAKFATDDALKANRKKMATTPEMCQIVCLGMAADDGEIVTLLAGEDGVTETDILTTFWAMAARTQRFVGFNLANFDLPAIFFRSILLGVPATRFISIDPYRGNVLDLQIARFGKYPEKGFGLKNIAKLCHIDVPSGDVSGGNVERLMGENPQAVKWYQASDITITRKIHRAYSGYFCQ